jgi:thiol-disulfide isomerase/thioredoxin
VRVNLGRRAVIGSAATLLAALTARKSARAEEIDLHTPDSITPVTPPTALPDLPFHTLDGAPTALKRYSGKPIVLNFWATWCIPCVAELPELDTLAAGGGITVLAVSADRSGAAAVKPFLAKHKLAHAIVLLDASSDAARAMQVVGFPTTLIIDPTGHLRGRLEGPCTWSNAVATVRRLTA